VDFAGGDPGCAHAGDPDERRLPSEGAPSLPCDDGADNDGDLRIDFDPVTFASPGNETTLPAGVGDPGCKTPSWPNEKRGCQDGLNNDNQPGVDYDGGNSLDLDDDGFIDAAFNPAQPAVGARDPQCANQPWRDLEAAQTGCGLGFELALLAQLRQLEGRASGFSRG
jgi:hypothetical protein